MYAQLDECEVNSQWIDAKYQGVCARCHRRFDVGHRILFNILTRKCICKKCGERKTAPTCKRGLVYAEGKPCRHCNTPVKIQYANPKQVESAKKRNSYYFEYYFKCPKEGCRAIYLIEDAKRFPVKHRSKGWRKKPLPGSDAPDSKKPAATSQEVADSADTGSRVREVDA